MLCEGSKNIISSQDDIIHDCQLAHLVLEVPKAKQEVKRLLSKNYRFIGQGDDAIVFGHPNEAHAIRIGLFPKLFTHFISLITETKTPNFPRIYEHKLVANFSITRMEFLWPIHHDDRETWLQANSAISYAYCLADKRPLIGQAIPKPQMLRQSVEILSREAVSFNWALDLNRNNILQRSQDKSIVFTDPFCKWGE